MKRFGIGMVMLAGVVACAGPRGMDETELDAAGVPVLFRSSLGFDPVGTESEWGPGDVVLGRLDLEHEGSTRRWYLQARYAGPKVVRTDTGESSFAQMTFTFTTDDGMFGQISPVHELDVGLIEIGTQEMTWTRAQLPEITFATGLHRCGEITELAGREQLESLSSSESDLVRQFVLGCASTQSVLALLQENRQLEPLLWSVIAKPNPLRILLDGGLRVKLDFGHTTRRMRAPLPGKLGELSCFSQEARILVNGQPVLDCTFDAVAAVAPFCLTGGIVRMIGRHPEREWPRVVVQIVGAQRGE